jgi:hypothetical protein
VGGASAALVAALSLSGCPHTPPPPPPNDAGPTDDAVVIDRTDTDGDGLCDATESAWGTDPTVADTDGDGLTDRAERDFGYAPLRPDSPGRGELVLLEEDVASSTQLGIDRVVRGEGETYSGAFESLPVVDPLGLLAADFLVSSVAVGAVPMENVFEVRPTEERFVGVFGRTDLVFEASFRFGATESRGCARAYPFRYQIKRDDGAVVYLVRYLLVVLPAGERLDTATWCTPDGGCI